MAPEAEAPEAPETIPTPRPPKPRSKTSRILHVPLGPLAGLAGTQGQSWALVSKGRAEAPQFSTEKSLAIFADFTPVIQFRLN